MTPSYALMLSKGNNAYKAETGEVKRVDTMHGSWMENVMKEGILKIPIQVGYGVSWNDDIDMSEYELWNNSVEILMDEL